MGLALAANRRIHRGYIQNSLRITSRLLACWRYTSRVKLLELLELVVLAQHFAVSAKALACTSLAPDLYPNMSLVNDEHVVDEYVSYDELWERWTLFLHAFLNDRAIT